ncbi:N-acyl-D-amino-acid deacylase family protein [Rhizorhabdus dicambivorans]|uniref:Aminoacylase n=2 Tax=Rhizorhabdus dicambivorans TaxID=1850238 RepID=A0A2A4FTS0_9SPHN|nr:amidohydrolase family protein [Rhizorhabdus dicambivorans]PCE41096.1 aminoacylase [Rhizorhabdus dicambivorans]
MYDIIIRNGRIVDGTGAPARSGAVAISGERIVGIGDVDGPARREIDAGGQIVAPGFVDVHTHYDAQVFWDPLVTPSINHGVTTVIGGNCGFTIAPLSGRPEDADYLVRMLARVEGMPLESLRAAVPMDWTGFGEYLDRLDGTLAINTGFMVGHSALRRTVMGERAIGHHASADEIAAMQELLRASIRAGGLGFSSTISTTHLDAEGQPVPSRHAAEEELIALASVVSEFPGTTLEFLPIPGLFGEQTYDLLTRLSLAAQRPLNWNAIIPNAHAPEIHRSQIAASDYAAARGARVVGLVMADAPHLRLNMLGGVLIDSVEGIAEYFRLPLDDRCRAFADPEVRRRIGERAAGQAGHARKYAQWQDYEIVEVFSEENRRWLGRMIGEVAAERGVSPLDAILDVALADELRTNFLLRSIADDDASWAMRGEVWTDDRVVIGASDAGAHLDMIDTFAFSSKVLGEGVRRRKLLSLEEAVHRLTQVPAELIGIRDRGCLREGAFADIVIFDPDRIGCGPTSMRFDLPAGGNRLYCDPIGVSHVLVNGREVARDGVPNGELAGTMLRSGRD